MKAVLVGMMKMGWKGWWGSNVLVASKLTLSLAALVHEVTGEAEPSFALSFGRQAVVRKLTIQVMRSSGEILGYMKLPLTDAAGERLRNEARTLERLWKFPALRTHVPRLLYAGSWNHGYVFFQSALEGKRGPLTFNHVHEKFLRTLRSVYSVELPGQTVVGALAAKWEKAVPRLGAEWEKLGLEVLRRSSRDLPGKVLRCGVMHGDFAPWNTRVQQENLLLFDWESADWEAPTSWDMFHFQVQATYFFRKKERFQVPQHEPSDRVSFMLFLLHSVCRFLEEENHLAIVHHKRLLIRAFEGGQP